MIWLVLFIGWMGVGLDEPASVILSAQMLVVLMWMITSFVTSLVKPKERPDPFWYGLDWNNE